MTNQHCFPEYQFQRRASVLRVLLLSGGLLLGAQFSQAHAEVPVKQQVDSNVLRLGAGVGFGPRYSGSDQNTGSAALMFDYAMQNGFYISSLRGIGYGGTAGDFSYSAALGYRSGRKDSDGGRFSGGGGSNFLRGMGEIKGSATTMLGVGYNLTERVNLHAMLELPLSQRDNGKALHVGIIGSLLDQPGDKLSLGTRASFGDGKYTQTYYGVTDQQSASSGFAAYRPKSGLYAVHTDLTWEHRFDATWSLVTVAGVTSLSGDAAKSPIVKRKTAPSGGVYVSYTY